jgi:hypothetical protein
MTVGSVRTEGDNHIGLNAPDVRNNVTKSNGERDLIDPSIRVSQKANFADTQNGGGRPELRFPNAAKSNRIAGFTK